MTEKNYCNRTIIYLATIFTMHFMTIFTITHFLTNLLCQHRPPIKFGEKYENITLTSAHTNEI